MRVFKMTAVLLLAGATAYAQDETARKVATEVAARVPLEKATLNAPYSADTTIESLQLLADGNRIVRKTTGRVYRDSEGRTRREELRPAVSRETPYIPNAGMMITIVDPVAGFSYALDADTKTAWRTPTGTAAAIMEKLQVAEQKQRLDAQQKQKLEAEQVGAGKAAAAGEVRMRTATGEVGFAYAATPGPLEHKTIDGIAVDGRRTTTTIPAGTVGNEQPLTIVSEEWRSPDLGILVMTHHSDPRSGESSYRLTNIQRVEPDPSLFVVPADYTVRDTAVRRMLEAKK
jgi:hypothetical protein